MITYRTKYKGLIAEMLIPEIKNGTTVIILPGLPMSLGKNPIYNSLVNSGFLVILPQYSGSYDSSGFFEFKKCVKDVKKIIELAKKDSINELYFNKNISIKNKKISMIATSFGGSVAVCANKYLSEIDSLVLLSPVIEYNQKKISNLKKDFDFKSQMNGLFNLIRSGYKFTYRIKKYNIFKKDMFGIGLCKPIDFFKKISIPTLVIHGQKDTSVPFDITQKIQNSFKNDLINWFYPENVGHSMSSYNDEIINEIIKFIKK